MSIVVLCYLTLLLYFLQELVPAAQFDWTGSGLTNPLDCKYHITVVFA